MKFLKSNLKIKRIALLLVAYLFIFININLFVEAFYVETHNTPVITDSSQKIGTISLYASPVVLPKPTRITGHSWIYIKNTSDNSFYIDDVIVPPGEGISMGTTANPKMGHRGIWINVEGYNEHYKENVSISGDFYEEDLIYIEDYLEEHDKWNIIYNCAFFSTEIWNNVSAGQGHEIRSITPVGLSLKLLNEENHRINSEINVFEYMKPYKLDWQY